MTIKSAGERWAPVVGYEGLYEVSSLGQVRSIDRVEQCGPRLRRRAGRTIQPWLDTAGRPCVLLHRDGRSKGQRIHVLAAAAFLGPKPEGQLIRHLDDVRTNNVLSNLAYGTKSDNWHDGVRNGCAMRVRQPKCGRGHRRVAPNLTPDDSCLACSRARTAVANQHGLARGHSEVDVVADLYYSKIMGSQK